MWYKAVMAYTYKKDPSITAVAEETRRERVRKKLGSLFRRKELPQNNVVLEKQGDAFMLREGVDDDGDWVTLSRQDPEGIPEGMISDEQRLQNGIKTQSNSSYNDDDDDDVESRELRELWLSRLRRESMEEQIARACGTRWHRDRRRRRTTEGNAGK